MLAVGAGQDGLAAQVILLFLVLLAAVELQLRHFCTKSSITKRYLDKRSIFSSADSDQVSAHLARRDMAENWKARTKSWPGSSRG